jgi:hypothetical protein
MLLVVDASGPHVLRSLHLSAPPIRRGAVAFTLVSDSGRDKVRHTRPAHFLLLARLVEGAADIDISAMNTALADVAHVKVQLDGAPIGLTDRLLQGVVAPAGVRFWHADQVLLTSGRFDAGCVLCRPAVHRLQETVEAPLTSRDGRLLCTMRLSVRA